MTEYVWDKSKRQKKDFIPPISILIAGLAFLVGTGLAILWYETPNGKYKFFDQFFSELGVRSDYIRENSTELVFAPQNPELFNLSLIVSGFFVIFFFPFTYRQMRNRRIFSRWMFLISIFFGALTGPLFMLVGFVDLSVVQTSFATDHHFWAGLLYIFISIAGFFWLLGITFSKDLPYHSTKWIFVDYLLIILLNVSIFISLLDNLGLVPLDNIPFFNAFNIEVYQKFMAFTFFVYYGLIVGIRLLNTKYDNTPGLRKI